jgi:hypothetical protein
VKPPVSNARKTFSNSEPAEEVLTTIGVVRRHAKTARPRMLEGLGPDHESITLHSPELLELIPDLFGQNLRTHPIRKPLYQ